jgi:putative phosphoesterase
MNSVTIGLIADTHVPDRCRRLNPAILPIFAKAGVSTILHAGDISVPRVLRELVELAPVLAVRGNRDWFGFKDLPMQRVFTVGKKRIGLTHGHGSGRQYMRDKVRYLFRGPQKFEFFMKRALGLINNVDVLVFGHNHEPMVKEVVGMLVVNPGSACRQALDIKPPSVALLYINDENVKAEIIYLE